MVNHGGSRTNHDICTMVSLDPCPRVESLQLSQQRRPAKWRSKVVLHSETVGVTHMARYPSRFAMIHSKNRDEEKLRLAKHPSRVSLIDTFKVSRGGDTPTLFFVLNKEAGSVSKSTQSYLHSETVRVTHMTRYPSRFSMIQSKSPGLHRD
jgi:hypothetical protein